MISYGGVELTEPDQGVHDWSQANLSLDDTVDWSALTWPGPRRLLWATSNPVMAQGVRLGRLYWPVGASRWSSFHCIVTDTQLARIRKLAYPANATLYPNQYTPLNFVLTEGAAGFSITTSLSMLPPRPLGQIATPAALNLDQMWLITLVDDRWFWWERAVAITVTGGVTTWSQLYAAIGTGLGVTITPDAISSNYLFPSTDLATPSVEFLPPLLDAAAWSVGQRVVRNLAGVVTTQNARTAIASQKAQVAKYQKQAGGLYSYDVKG